MATPVDVDTATVEKVQGTTRRNLEELEDTVAAAVESSGVGYLRPLVCFIPCDYYRSRDDTTLLFAALRHMTCSRQRVPIRSSFNLAAFHPIGCAQQIAERCQHADEQHTTSPETN